MLRKNSVQITSTSVPTMEGAKKAGVIIGYKAFQAEPESPDALCVEITVKKWRLMPGTSAIRRTRLKQ